MAILLLTDDLVLGSQVSLAAKKVGGVVQIASNNRALLEICRDAEISRVILDMSCAQVGVADLVPALRQACSPTTNILAVASHVHAGKIDAARQAGCDQVMTRGEFHANLDTLFQGDA